MKRFIWGAILASVIWGYFAGGREQLIRAWQTMGTNNTTEAVTADRRIEELKTERENAFLASYKMSNGCTKPQSELAKLECRNQMDMARRSFYTRWNSANAARFQN